MKILSVVMCCMSVICSNKDENKHFVPDISVNNILKIQNQESSYIFYNKIGEMAANDSIRPFPVRCFSNESASEYLLAYHYYGNEENSFALFEFGYFTDCSTISDFVKLPINSFCTESGISLNADFHDIVDLKGNNYERLSDNTIRYKVDDFKNSTFLQSYNMPEYFMECEFSKNKLSKIIFGFSYP